MGATSIKAIDIHHCISFDLVVDRCALRFWEACRWTIINFKEIILFSLSGEYDHLPEVAFYMVGDISEAVTKAEKLAEEVQ